VGQLEALYDLRCGDCGGVLPDLADELPSFDDIYDKICKAILEGTDTDIDMELYFKTAQALMEAVRQGLNQTGPAYDEEAAILAARLQDNIYAFSAAKSFSQ